MENEKARLRKSIYYPIGISILLWLIKALEWSLAMDFGSLGILPRTLQGTSGILLSGFIHGDVFHLMSNTIPLVLLAGTIIYFYDQKGFRIILFLYLLTGSMVWLFARPAYHIGASGLVYGMLSFLLFTGLIRRDRQTLAISFTVLILYGGSMFSGLVPGDPRISWESHLIGFGLGVLSAIYYRKTPLSIDKKNVDEEDVIPSTSINDFYSSTSDNDKPSITFRYYYKEKKSSDE